MFFENIEKVKRSNATENSFLGNNVMDLEQLNFL